MPLTTEQGRIAAQAADWIISLTGDDPAACAKARSGFDAWKQADPRHAAAALRMEAMLGQIDAFNGRPARAALAASDTRRRAGRKTAAATGVALAVALLAGLAAIGVPSLELAVLMAEVRTGTGEWKTRTLEDGSRITLNSGSAVDLRFSKGQRVVRLLRGEVLVDVARDPGRPFLVQTAEGSIRALGTRFVVERGGGVTDLAMLESKTEVRGKDLLSPATVVTAGEKVRVTAHGVGLVQTVDPVSVAAAWRHHQLVVQNRPLSEVLDELARHRRGIIQYDGRQIAAMRVSAVLPLDDTDRALHLLLSSFPALRIRTVTPYVVMVDAPAS
ncbi:FecR domain-containing protein [Duganella sp. HH101]|uniref:FecR family protein n=1 Tax=Duganella sp. HH101 TaxID=1781066 RepID=UPI000874BAD6|nr:FecR domain-containing protein [Duganella sp. HH101]OFA07030.1 fec operon regulator FecR [Duganella sp. HH101]